MSGQGGIAIVGMACWYPGARDVRQLWENVLARRREFRRMPERRLDMGSYFDPDPKAPDKTYANRAAVLDGFVFDWARYLIPQSTYLATDIAQWLSLEVADKALADAGYQKGTVPKEKTGVLLGNSLTGEQMRSNFMRARWPFVRRALESASSAAGLGPRARAEIAGLMEARYKSVFPPVSEDTLAGSLSNTIAGRICNFFDLHGGGYVVDAACASSLVAVVQAAEALERGTLDLALAGGVDISLDTLEFVGFAKATALTADDMHVYDRRGAGFIPAEGCGFVVLKREEDARQANDPIYAVIRGWGLSSDGKGGIMQPTRKGQALALRRAYAKAGYPASSLDMVEGHGTGTRVGDKVEVEAISDVVADTPGVAARRIGLSSLKSVVGHAKAAAGIGALIKAALSANRRVLPPVANCKQWNAVFDDTAKALYPIGLGEVKDPTSTVRVGISAMGFGGINSHVTLESGGPPSAKLAPAIDERALLASTQSTELFVLAASSVPELLRQLPGLASEAERLSLGDLTDLSAHLASRAGTGAEVRAAVIASKPVELAEKLRTLQVALRDEGRGDGAPWGSHDKTMWVGRGEKRQRLGFVLPGQGSQQLAMARTLVERFGWARDIVEELDERRRAQGREPLAPLVYRPLDRAANGDEVKAWEKTLAQTQFVQPAICLASVLWAQHLANLGITPSVVAGHSLGELTAFHLAGAFDRWTLFSLASLRGELMAAPDANAGTMLSVACDRTQALRLIDGLAGEVTIANVNTPKQTVVSGSVAGIEEVARRGAAQAIDTRRLKVSNAFHSRFMDAGAAKMRTAKVAPDVLGALTCTLLSSTEGQTLAPGLALHTHFADQMLRPVDFVATAASLAKHCDLVLEVGPGRVLSGLLAENPGAPSSQPVASQPDADADLHAAVAAAWVAGVPVVWKQLHAERLVRGYVPASERTFIENNCEKPFEGEALAEVRVSSPGLGDLAGDLGVPRPEAERYLAARGAFLREALLAIAKADFASLGGRGESAAVVATVAAPKALEAPKPSAPVSVEGVLTELVATRTGYPASAIASSARLLDDLNVDSIKAGELIAQAARRFGVADKVDPGRLANASLEEIAQALQRAGAVVAAPAAAPIAVAAPPAPPKPAGLVEVLVGLVAEKTGYPAAQVSTQAKLLDDLNLDSIKAGELIARAARSAGVSGQVDPGALANASIEDIAQAIRRAQGPAAAAVLDAPPPPPTPLTRPTTESRLLALVVERTGYPAAQIDLRARLLDDLNLDSIKAGELIATVARELGVAGKVDAGALANASIQDIAKALDLHAPPARPSAPPPSGHASGDVESTVRETVCAVTGFGPSAVTAQSRLNDLGVAGDKLEALVKALGVRFEMDPRLDLPRVQDVTVGQLATIFTALLHKKAVPALSDPSLSDSPTWVRRFVVRCEPEPMPASEARRTRRTEDDWREAIALVVSDSLESGVAEALGARLLAQGARVEQVRFQDGAARCADPRFTHLFAVLPRNATGATGPAMVRAQLERLLSLAGTAKAEAGPRRRTTVAYVQHGHGHFGVGTTLAEPEMVGATSFARSLHLERSDLRVRVIDLSPALAVATAAQVVLEECAHPDAFAAVGFTADGERLVQRAVLVPPGGERRAKPLQKGEVVLVSGGGKGITAECALEWARRDGVVLAILGRQALESRRAGDELSVTLERLASAGIQYRYYGCDVVNAEAVRTTVERVRDELGPIAAVVHGAGVMKPRRAEQLHVASALEEIGPKLVGALNLCAALDDAPPRLMVGFTSLSGVMGVPGTTVYAYSNEAMDLVLRRFHAKHPGTEVVSAAWGPWGEVGRAVKFGTSDNLHRLGFHLGDIPNAEAVDHFLALVDARPPDSQVVVVGRVVGFDTWQQLRPPPSAPEPMRFLERVVRLEPQVELVARAQLSLEKDVYLHDHVFNGMYVVPSVFSLEAAAQAALVVSGPEWKTVRAFESVTLPRPIVVDADHGLELEVRAVVEPGSGLERRVRFELRTETTGFAQPYVAGVVVLAAETACPVAPQRWPEPLALDPSTELYGKNFFVRGRFQRLEQVLALAREKSIAKAHAKPIAQVDAFGGPAAGTRLVLGDPFLRDTFLHASILSERQAVALPVGFGRIDLYAQDARFTPGVRLAVSTLRPLGSEKDFEADLELHDGDGRLLERIVGFKIRVMHRLPSPGDRTDERLLQDAMRRATSGAPSRVLD